VEGGREAVTTELGLPDTNGILRQPWVHPDRTSAGLGWDRLYVSTQHERAYRASFAPADTHLLILHLSGPVTVSRGRTRLTASCRIPAGGLFLHPAGRDLTVELGGRLDTVHVYLADAALQESGPGGDADGAGGASGAGTGHPVRLAEELGSADPLVEQLMLALDGLVQRWEPSAPRTRRRGRRGPGCRGGNWRTCAR
jgi:AraC family transcriptional regulator